MVSDQGKYHHQGCSSRAILLGGALCFIRDEVLSYLGLGELRVVAQEKGGDGLHRGV